MTFSFLPLIFAPDRMICKPLGGWRQNLLEVWSQAMQDCLQKQPQITDLAPVFNQLGLIATFQGQTELAAHVCQSQMLYWHHLSQERGRPDLLAYVIQPYINLARLARWQANVEQAAGLYRGLAPGSQHQVSPLLQKLGIAHTFEELAAADSDPQKFRQVMSIVYWTEYGRLLLQTGDEASVLAHVQQGLSSETSTHIRRCLLETGLQVQCQHGRKPMKLLQALTSKLDFAARLPYLMIHLQLAAAHQLPEQEQVFAQVWQLLNVETIDWRRSNLLAMFDGCGKILLRLGYQSEALQMASRQRELARLIEDEALEYAAMTRLVEAGALSADALGKFDSSLYVQIRKARKQDLFDPLASGIEQALQELDRCDWQACADTLRDLCADRPAAQAI